MIFVLNIEDIKMIEDHNKVKDIYPNILIRDHKNQDVDNTYL